MYGKLKQQLFALSLLFAVPTAAFAAPANFKEFAAFIVTVLQNIIGILFASLAVGLLYGVVLFLANADNEKKRAEIKSYLLWGVIGIIVVMGIWGILALLHESVFGTGTIGIPQISPPTQ
jgi:succinate dehydrogenase/fumarate reductase cytochrome b subunit